MMYVEVILLETRLKFIIAAWTSLTRPPRHATTTGGAVRPVYVPPTCCVLPESQWLQCAATAMWR
eukprot:5289164-Amphidinium_carterae.1